MALTIQESQKTNSLLPLECSCRKRFGQPGFSNAAWFIPTLSHGSTKQPKECGSSLLSPPRIRKIFGKLCSSLSHRTWVLQDLGSFTSQGFFMDLGLDFSWGLAAPVSAPSSFRAKGGVPCGKGHRNSSEAEQRELQLLRNEQGLF